MTLKSHTSKKLPVLISWKKSNASRWARPASIDFDRIHYCNNNISNTSISVCLSLQFTNFQRYIAAYESIKVHLSQYWISCLSIDKRYIKSINSKWRMASRQIVIVMREIYILYIYIWFRSSSLQRLDIMISTDVGRPSPGSQDLYPVWIYMYECSSLTLSFSLSISYPELRVYVCWIHLSQANDALMIMIINDLYW